MTTIDKNKIINSLKRHCAKIAKERDELRELLNEIEEVVEACDTALENIESGIDDLSQYL